MTNEDFIDRGKRSKNVKDYDYGLISGFDMSYYDIPTKAEFSYSDSLELIYENYDKLIFYIENDLIPNNIIKKNISDDDFFYYIRLTDILKIKLSEKEISFMINYLKEKNIFVIGTSTTLEGEFENYKYYSRDRKQDIYNDLPSCLPDDEQKKLFLEYKKNPSLELKKRIAYYNSGLVLRQCNFYNKIFKIDIDELFGYGMIGLLKAIPLFDISLENKFSTFAWRFIKNEILSGISILKGTTFPGDYFAWVLNKIEIKKEMLLSEDSSVVFDLIECLIEKAYIKNSKEDREKVIYYCNLINCISLDELLLNNDEDAILSDVIKGYNENDYYSGNFPFEIVFSSALKDDISRVLDIIDERERDILKMIFGLVPYNESIRAEKIGKLYGITRQRVKQIEKEALDKLRINEKKRILSDYYD